MILRSLTLLALATSLIVAEDTVPAQLSHGSQTITVVIETAKNADSRGIIRAGAPAADDRLVAWRDGRVGDASAMLLIHRTVLLGIDGADPATVCAAANCTLVGPSVVAGTWVARPNAADATAVLVAAKALAAMAGVLWAEAETTSPTVSRFTPNDPLYTTQWHLKNTGQAGASAGNDLNVEAAWSIASGAGTTIAIVDTGVEYTHPDLAPGYRADLSTDISGGDADPAPEAGEFHGTSVTGTAVARGNNGIGVSGVSYLGSWAALRLTGNFNDTQEATAFGWHATETVATNYIHVENNSWGPPDSGSVVVGPGGLAMAAMAASTTSGRGNKGLTITWACGNGRGAGDIADYDGYAANRYTLAIAATTPDGKQADYSESGACLWFNGPVGESPTSGVVVTDRSGILGYNTAVSASGGDYTTIGSNLVGTSFSAPEAAGVAALVISAKPTLTWRDVRYVMAYNATKNDTADATWQNNGASLHWSVKYGFGMLNAGQAVAFATAFEGLGPAAVPVTATTADLATPLAIPESTTPASVSFSPTSATAFTVEVVEFTVAVTHAKRGEVAYTLVSPAGTRATVLARPVDTGANLSWTFTTPAMLGEPLTGTWKLEVRDTVAGTIGTLTAASLKFYGTARSASEVSNASSSASASLGVGPATDGGLNGGTPGSAGGSYDGGGQGSTSGGCGAGSTLGLILIGLWFSMRRLQSRR